MAVTYRPFDSGAGGDVTEDGWRAMARHWLRTGVLAGEGDELAVSERGAGATMSIDVATGEAWLRGHHMESDAVENLPISAADPTDDRIDRIVLAADFVANTIASEVLEGVPDPAPTAPALTQTAGRWEISLAQVLVGAAAASILDAAITDERQLVGLARTPLVLARSGATIDVVNSNVETTLFSTVIPAGLLGTDGVLRLNVEGDYLNNSGGTRVHTLRLKLGGTTLYDGASVAVGAAASRRAWNLALSLRNRDVANAQHLNGRFHLSGGDPTTGLGDMTTNEAVDAAFSSAAVDPAVDTSADVLLEVTIQLAVADANYSFRRKGATLELL